MRPPTFTKAPSHGQKSGVACCCRPVYSTSTFYRSQAVVSMSNILMNRTRSQIVRFLLRNGPASCSEIGSELRISSSAIRRHLALMHRAGLLDASDSSRYSASSQDVRAAAEAFSATLSSEGLSQTPRMPMG